MRRWIVHSVFFNVYLELQYVPHFIVLRIYNLIQIVFPLRTRVETRCMVFGWLFYFTMEVTRTEISQSQMFSSFLEFLMTLQIQSFKIKMQRFLYWLMMVVCEGKLVSFTLNEPNHLACGMVNMIAATATNGGSEPPCSDWTKQNKIWSSPESTHYKVTQPRLVGMESG